MQVAPRVYQTAAIKAALKGLRGHAKRALIVLATGLGKTLTTAFIAKKLRSRRVLFLVHNNFILKHAVDEFRLVFDEKTKMATYNGMSKNGAKDADIVFATWQTMGKNLKEWGKNHFDLVIVDEAHHSEADTYRPVVKYFSGPRLGITATPDRQDGSDIRDIFGTEVINIALEEAIARGWLPRIEYHVITDESLDEDALQEIAQEIRESKKRFTMAEVNRRIFIHKRDMEIARIINGYNEKAVVFCANIVHTERLGKSLELASTFHSRKGRSEKDTWEKNQIVLEALKNGLIRRVCAVNAFNEGVNVPSVGLIAFCRVTEAMTIFRQQLGRGLRPGKEKLVVLDFVGNLERIQLVLEIMNKISDLHERHTPRSEIEREGYERQQFEVSGKGFEFTFSDKIVDLMKVLEHCEREFYPTWQEASAAAHRLGLNNSTKYQKGYKEDPRLPSCPCNAYADCVSWQMFFTGKGKSVFYSTWQEAAKAASRLGIRSERDYKAFYKKDPKLPSHPRLKYPDFPGDTMFFSGKEKKNFYHTWQAASKAAKRLGIRTQADYRNRYAQDPRLPSVPRTYKGFPGWRMFLRGLEKKDLYPTWKEASNAARRLGFCSQIEYRKGYKKDPRLPSSPREKYNDFPGWKKFLGKE